MKQDEKPPGYKLLADFYSIHDCDIGEGTIVRDFVNLYGCKIGKDCKIAAFVEIQRGVVLGDRCKVEAYAFIPSGVIVEDEVFIGPHAVFTNDLSLRPWLGRELRSVPERSSFAASPSVRARWSEQGQL
jgi:UDP-2-acetamido-3-amino-2,3-dideoxy-glucuronate N-acetyltransferase